MCLEQQLRERAAGVVMVGSTNKACGDGNIYSASRALLLADSDEKSQALWRKQQSRGQRCRHSLINAAKCHLDDCSRLIYMLRCADCVSMCWNLAGSLLRRGSPMD